MPLPVWLPTWLTNLLGGGWIRNALGIRKDLIDTKKSKLEVKRLEHEEQARSRLITLATFDDVKKYDPKYRQIRSKRQAKFPSGRKVGRKKKLHRRDRRQHSNFRWWPALLLLLIVLLAWLLIKSR